MSWLAKGPPSFGLPPTSVIEVMRRANRKSIFSSLPFFLPSQSPFLPRQSCWKELFNVNNRGYHISTQTLANRGEKNPSILLLLSSPPLISQNEGRKGQNETEVRATSKRGRRKISAFFEKRAIGSRRKSPSDIRSWSRPFAEAKNPSGKKKIFFLPPSLPWQEVREYKRKWPQSIYLPIDRRWCEEDAERTKKPCLSKKRPPKKRIESDSQCE